MKHSIASSLYKGYLLKVILFVLFSAFIYNFLQPIWVKYTALHFLQSESEDIKVSSSLLSQIEALSYGSQLQKKDGYRIVLTVRPDFIAEFYALYRLAQAIEAHGWDYAIIINADSHQEAVKILNPDFIISIRSDMHAVPGFVNFLYLHSWSSHYSDQEGNFKAKDYKHLLEYDGFLSLLPSLGPIETYFKQNNKSFYYIDTYFSSLKTNFSPEAKLQLSFWGSALWDSGRSSEKYLNLYKNLDQKEYFRIYGPKETWKNYRSYEGFLPIEGNALIEKIKERGVALLLHSHEHLAEGVPTSRIFEALAASAIIISDNHPFLKKHFADCNCILFIDQTASSEEMFYKIEEHMDWIRLNQEQAIEKARVAHQIFVDKFSLEVELYQIA